MPNSGTEIIIPKHRHRSHSSVSSGSTYRAISPYRNQTYVTGPPTAVQYGPTFPAATALPPYMAPATSMVSAVPLVQQPFGLSAPMIPAVQPVQPVVTSYVPAMGNVYGDGMGYGGYGYPYRYGMGYGGGMYGAQWPGSGMGYGYGYGGGAMYYPQYSGGMGYGGYGGGAYPYMGSAYEYYGVPRAPFNQRIAGALEEFGGHIINSPRMIRRGYARRIGYPLLPSTAQDTVRRRMVNYGGVRYVPGVGPTYL